MRIHLLPLLIVFILLAFAACVYENPVTSPEPEPIPYACLETSVMPPVSVIAAGGTFDAPLNYWEGLSLYVPAASITPTRMQLLTRNNSYLTFGHGVPYTIQQYVNGVWQQVPFINDVFWVNPLLTVPAKTSTGARADWEHMHGALPPGQYRLVREFQIINWFDPRPVWQQDISRSYLYALFTVEEHWAYAYAAWHAEQDALAAIAFARFEGLELEILYHSQRGLSFSLANNNPRYSYIIDGVCMGWTDNFPEGGHISSMEYMIFLRGGGWPTPSWPFEDDVLLKPGDILTLDVDWYYKIGNLTPRLDCYPDFASPTPHIFELVIDVILDVDEQYIRQYFRHFVQGLPTTGYRISKKFEIE